MDKFEYKILTVPKARIEGRNFQADLMDTLNGLGKEGWEIITVEGINENSIFWQGSETVDLLFFLKRRI